MTDLRRLALSGVFAILATTVAFASDAPAAGCAVQAASLALSARLLEPAAAPKVCTPAIQVAQERGTVCRNGSYTCTGIGSGIIGYSCCGCGFCGWWSAD